MTVVFFPALGGGVVAHAVYPPLGVPAAAESERHHPRGPEEVRVFVFFVLLIVLPCCRVFDVVVLGEDEGDFLPGKARDLRFLELVLLEDFFQPGIVPLALDFVEGHVEELFFPSRQGLPR